jgi:outer membrane cobalamin receptor
LSGVTQGACGQQFTIRGKISDSKDKKPVEYATVFLSDNRSWTVADENGVFILKNVPRGPIALTIQCLGYVKTTFELNVKGDRQDLVFLLAEDNLALDEVVVTATQKTKELTTSYTIDRTTLDHAQILNVSDILSLLPGGKSPTNQGLTSSPYQRLALRSSTNEKGNASFGTALEVDGVRLQNNAAFDETKGADVRNISSTNIESIEIITGIPSVEYGDLSNGVVIFNTKKGKTPLTIELSTTPSVKQAAISKGVNLGANSGTLNTGFEHTKSISDPASPYESYVRNVLSLKYTNTLNRTGDMPLSLEAGFSGNLGGYNSKADPDTFRDNYVRKTDNNVRGNIRMKWLLNRPWITNAELSGSVSYSDKRSTSNANKSSSSSQAANHSMEEGYFIAASYDKNPDAPVILVPPGYWDQLYHHDNKPVSQTAGIKADWIRQLSGAGSNRLMTGAEFNRSANKGRGTYYENMENAPTWHEYRYDEKSPVNNVALYAEDRLTLAVDRRQAPLGKNPSKLEVTAGLRSDITVIKDSEYGTVKSLAPRVKAKYTFWEKAGKTVRDFNIYAGWGKAVKLPSLDVLYPRPTYSENLAFAPGTMADGSTFYAYYTIPSRTIYNPSLKWQHSEQLEAGTEMNIRGVRITLSAFRSKTFNPYICVREYTPYSYKQTDQRALNNVPIPAEDRQYAIDRTTGIVTVSDRNGLYESRQLDYTTRNTYRGNNLYKNGSPVERKGLEWIIEFPKIPAIKTAFRLDGSYYHYRGTDETIIAWKPTSNMADGNPFGYIGYYAGSSTNSTSGDPAASEIMATISSSSASISNGSASRELNANLTATTHIPAIRMIFSVKLEASLYDYTQALSEYNGGNYGFALADPEGYSGDDTDIYRGNVYVAKYPLYYTTWDDPKTKIPFAEKFAWAKTNDPALYGELAKLVVKSNTAYYFNPNEISPYFSANISVTKEIGDFASLSFDACNFFNNRSRVKTSNNGMEYTLYRSGYIPRFYYGLSLRLKL